jgi:hypothetical protein
MGRLLPVIGVGGLFCNARHSAAEQLKRAAGVLLIFFMIVIPIGFQTKSATRSISILSSQSNAA